MSGLIYAAIVVAWAAYLVPLALRRHDEKVRARSVDRFSAAMRVLARHPAESLRVPSGQGLRTERAGPAAAVPAPRPNHRVARVAAARRRRVLLILVASTLVVAGAAIAGLLPLWSVPIAGAPPLGFLVTCRRQVRRRNETDWVEAQAREPEPSVVIRQAQPQGGLDEAVAEPLAEPERVVAVTVPTADGGSLWDPLPVTLPTYLSKPKAPRTVRAISLGEPGTWTSGRLEAPAAAAGQEQVSPPSEEDERRRAVGT